MKRMELKGGRKLIMLLLLLITGATTYAQPVISGTIIDSDTQNVVNHIVELTTDTSMGVQYPYYAVDTTDENGHFSFTLPQNLQIGIYFVVKTMSCGQPVTHTYQYPYNSNSADFNICPVNRYLKGTVYKNFMPSELSMVYLYKKHVDSSGTTVELQDTMSTDMYGKFMFLLPVSSQDSYLVKAALLPEDTADYNNYIPTYFMGNIRWSDANSLANANATIDVALTPGMAMQGQAYIAGSVITQPVYKRLLILTTDNDVPVAYRYTDQAGEFGFGALDHGTYKIFGDVVGKDNPALVVSLDVNNAFVSSIVFQETSTSFFGTLFPLDVNTVGKSADPVIYPNPVSDHLHIQGLDKISGEKRIALYNINGAVVYTRTVTGDTDVLIPFAELGSGLYFLQVNTLSGTSTYKIMK